MNAAIAQQSRATATPKSEPQNLAAIKEREASTKARIADLRALILKRSKVTVAQSGILTKFVSRYARDRNCISFEPISEEPVVIVEFDWLMKRIERLLAHANRAAEVA